MTMTMTMHGCAYGGIEPPSWWIQAPDSGLELKRYQGTVVRDRGTESSEGSNRRLVSHCTVQGKPWRIWRVRRARSNSG